MIEPTAELRALTVKRPWSYCIAHLGKGLENREWKRPGVPPVCRYRGELFIHAGQGWDPKAAPSLFDAGVVGLLAGGTLSDKREHPAGVIVARCRAVGHIEPVECTMCQGSAFGSLGCMACGGRGVDSVYHGDERHCFPDLRWWHGGYALVIADVVALPDPVPCKGRLGVWRVPADVAARLRRSA